MDSSKLIENHEDSNSHKLYYEKLITASDICEVVEEPESVSESIPASWQKQKLNYLVQGLLEINIWRPQRSPLKQIAPSMEQEEVMMMKKESVNPVNEKPIYTQFTCPDCGGHHLGAKVECDATVTGFDALTTYFIFDEKQDQEHAIALFFCNDCEWNASEESFVRDYMK